MKVLVTGATGFIGNHIVQQLLQHGCSVIATSLHQQKAEKAQWFHLVDYVPFDIETFDAEKNYYVFFNSPDAVIHLAWEGLPNYKNKFHIEKNLPLHAAFLKNLISNGLTDVTVTGTCFEYGMQEGMLNERLEAIPQNAYAIAKHQLNLSLQQIQHSSPFVLKWVRLFYMWGKGQNPNSLLSQLDAALANGEAVFNMSGGEQERDFLPVEKVAEYIVKIALQKTITGTINCCSGKPVMVKNFVEDYLKAKDQNIKLNLGYHPYPDYEPMRFWGDPSKLKTILENE